MSPEAKALLAKVLRKVGIPAAHTFWQTFTGLITVWWAASGADLAHQVTSVAAGDRFITAALAAVIAAALSAGKTAVAGVIQILPKVVAL